MTSWIETREHAVEKSNLVILFDKYIPPCLENIRNRFKKIIPITEMSHIQMLCHLLECILVPANTPMDCPKEWYELYFTFVCIWSFGAAIYQEQVRTKIRKRDLKTIIWKITNVLPNKLNSKNMLGLSTYSYTVVISSLLFYNRDVWTTLVYHYKIFYWITTLLPLKKMYTVNKNYNIIRSINTDRVCKVLSCRYG